MSRIEFLSKLRVFIASVVFLVVTTLAACGPESSKQQSKSKETVFSDNSTHVLSSEVNAVTEQTRQVYQWYCAQCHGAKGQGDGVNAPHLVVPPRDHTKAYYLETRSDQQLFEAIKLGGLTVGRAPCMPAWEHTLDDETIRSLVSYIRDLCNCKAL